MSTDNLRKLVQAPLVEVVNLLLRQCAPWLEAAGKSLDVAQCRDLAIELASDDATAAAAPLIDNLKALVDSDLTQVLELWRSSFREFLAMDVADIGDWQSTADLLDLANDKAELEQRIVILSALLVICGKREYGAYLLEVIEFDDGVMDLDAVIARRALMTISGVENLSSE